MGSARLALALALGLLSLAVPASSQDEQWPRNDDGVEEEEEGACPQKCAPLLLPLR